MPTMTKVHPGAYGFPVSLKKRYDNYIGGKWAPPASGEYFDNVTPVTGQVICQIARSNAADVERALDAAHAAKSAWGKTSQADRGRMLERIAQRIEDNLRGKPWREISADTFRNGHGDIDLSNGLDRKNRLPGSHDRAGIDIARCHRAGH